jgi:hypothetical protein
MDRQHMLGACLIQDKERQSLRTERLLQIHGKAANNPDLFRPLPALRRSATTTDTDHNSHRCPSPTSLRDIRKRQGKVQRLYALQRRRIDLAAQVAAAECRLAHALQPTLEDQLKAVTAATATATIATTTTIATTDQSLALSNTKTSDAAAAVPAQSKVLPDNHHHHHTDPSSSKTVAQWHAIRRAMCLDSAFRLSGISIYPNQDELLALRFDIHLGNSSSNMPNCTESDHGRSSSNGQYRCVYCNGAHVWLSLLFHCRCGPTEPKRWPRQGRRRQRDYEWDSQTLSIAIVATHCTTHDSIKGHSRATLCGW